MTGALNPGESLDRFPRSLRDWMADTGWFLLAIAGGAAAFLWAYSVNPSTPDQLLSADPILGGLTCIALFFSRRWPLGVALTVVPASLLSASSSVALMVLLFTVASRRRFREAALVGVLYTLSGTVFCLLRLPMAKPLWFSALLVIVMNLLINGAILAWGMYLGARRQLVLSLRERAARAEAEQQLRVEQARRLERERIAREMHDALAHRISLLSLHAGALELRLDAPRNEVARAAAVIQQNAHEALRDLKKVIFVLRDPTQIGTPDGSPQPPQPTFADLPGLIADSRQAGVGVKFENRLGDLATVPATTGRDGYRIVQEGLTNARKHAPASEVNLLVFGGPGAGVTIELRNRLGMGRTPPAIPGTGTGIVGLIERARLAGGRLLHGPTSEGDYRLWAWLPWAE